MPCPAAGSDVNFRVAQAVQMEDSARRASAQEELRVQERPVEHRPVVLDVPVASNNWT
jgi:hypothetical protein